MVLFGANSLKKCTFNPLFPAGSTSKSLTSTSVVVNPFSILLQPSVPISSDSKESLASSKNCSICSVCLLSSSMLQIASARAKAMDSSVLTVPSKLQSESLCAGLLERSNPVKKHFFYSRC